MVRGSIWVRLVMLWVVILAVVLPFGFYGLQFLFERSLYSRTIAELSRDLVLIAEAVDVDGRGAVNLGLAPRDPLFEVVYSGRYWQILRAGEAVRRSPSLWGSKLAVPADVATPERKSIRLAGPDDQQLFAVVLLVAITSGVDRRPLTIVVAADLKEIETSKQRFSTDLFVGLALLGVLLLIAASMQVVIGLKPLRELQNKLADVRKGDLRRLSDDFPSEVRPLIAETNALLDMQDAALAFARARANDLAHGLKTPLAVMASQSRILRRRGDSDIANHLDSQIELMRRHVERELARARTRGAGPTHHARVETSAAIRRLTGAMQLLPRGQEITWQLALTENLSAPVDGVDFDELMGNLIDNAHKWAKSTVSVTSRRVDDKAVICVEDDGPGIAEADAARILQRGERADPTVAGTGLGLAIVSDLIAAYCGTFQITRSKLGGLAATVTLKVSTVTSNPSGRLRPAVDRE